MNFINHIIQSEKWLKNLCESEAVPSVQPRNLSGWNSFSIK